MFYLSKTKAFSSLLILFIMVTAAHAGLRDRIKELGQGIMKARSEPDIGTVAAGLKEALSIGTVNAVTSVSKTNGYLGNSVIRIPLPENVEKAAKVLSSLGMQKQVDEFIVSMNRAAEKAAPHAKSLFINAVKQMTFQDAMNILKGNDTAATDYLHSKTSRQLYTAFLPIVKSAMNEVGVTRSYKRMMDKAVATRLVRREDVDLDYHVTSKALDGMFYMVGQEERRIRKDPAARVTELLKKVFANQQ
jgi:RNA binding exosome subunit